jgi:hypothetical protein
VREYFLSLPIAGKSFCELLHFWVSGFEVTLSGTLHDSAANHEKNEENRWHGHKPPQIKPQMAADTALLPVERGIRPEVRLPAP